MMATRPVSAPRMALAPMLDDDHTTRLNLTLAIFMFASFLVFTPAWLMDTRLLDSAAVWTKPQKFNISLGLHFFTIAVLLQLVPRDVRTGPVLIGFSYLAAIALVFEFVWVSLQAAQAKRSHFNFDSGFEAMMYALMGLGAFFLMTIAMALAVQIWRKGDRTRRGLWLGAIVGLTVAFFSTLYFGFTMSNSGRYVGAELSGGGATVPFFGWSREYGDLRPAHFVSLHMMQTVPLAGWLADRFGWNAVLVVSGVSLVQLALAAALFAQALAGQPFWPA
ncbi:hypothetical protein NAP1_15313 [Erythrobacter sp. NAP1]|uniref:hypothetical protein n=1 Tax=Erythrobacter sp. NAP1 TaxID=237727 RepID=UPI00006878C9|nr:hypothetical protein [Erythrobacter sp. NAP1]EAQ28980.1 hypothetical protein NAP1_15313 [Erythrobacter sp. NAP1]